MIKFENTEVFGWEAAIRGMRNPMNSWEKSDSIFCKPIDCKTCEVSEDCGKYGSDFDIGPKDHRLMMNLSDNGTVHRKFMRMITVYVDITAPLYWWKEFDTYKVGTVANSCSTMHKIHEKEFTLDDFSCEHLITDSNDVFVMDEEDYIPLSPKDILQNYIVEMLNESRQKYLETKNKKYWWQMIQLLPSSYNQKRTIMLNYEVLANIYKSRKNHKLDEWSVGFIQWIESLPYSELITGDEEIKRG